MDLCFFIKFWIMVVTSGRGNEKEVKERTWEQFTSKYCNSSVIGQAPKIGSPNDSNAVLH